MPTVIPFVSGAPVLRVEDERLLTGGGQFLDDREVSDLAHAAVVRSPYPHARILEVDVAAARIIPGVLLVLIGEDYVADGLGSIPCQDACQMRDGTPRPDLPFPALARERVLYVGEAVALVVAETEVIARDAAELVEVTYEPLPANTELDRAAEDGMPLLWPQCPANEVFYATQGDPQSTDIEFANAAHIVRQRLVISVSRRTHSKRGVILAVLETISMSFMAAFIHPICFARSSRAMSSISKKRSCGL